MSAKIPADITPGTANDGSKVHASDANVSNLSRSHDERDISRLQSAIKDYSASKTYEVDDLVFDNGTEYRCITQITVPESFDPAKWVSIGSGDVVGPASSTANQIAKFLDATGKEITNSVVQIDALGRFTSVLNINSHGIPGGSDDFATLDANQILTNKTLGTNNKLGADFDSGGFNYLDTGNIRFETNGGMIPNADIGVTGFPTGMVFNVPTANTYVFLINGIPVSIISPTALALAPNNNLIITNDGISALGYVEMLQIAEAQPDPTPSTDAGIFYVEERGGQPRAAFIGDGRSAVTLEQTPWEQNIDAAGFNIQNLETLEFQDAGVVPPGNVRTVYANSSALNFNTQAGNVHDFRINDAVEYTFSASSFSLAQNNNIIIGNDGTSANGYVQMEEIPNAQGDPTVPATTGIFYVKEVGGEARPYFAGDGTAATDLIPDISCKVTKSSDQSIPNTSFTAITWDQESYDTDSMHDNVINNSRITINTAGKYSILAQAEWANNNSGVRQLQIRKNGTETLGMTRVADNQAGAEGIIAVVGDFAVNDYIELRVWQNSGGNLNFTTGFGGDFLLETYLEAHKIN